MKGEEEGVDTMQGINKVLLENLLPAHVARHFLTNIKVFYNLMKKLSITFRRYFNFNSFELVG